MTAWSGLGVNAIQPSEYWSEYTEQIGAPFVPLVTDNFRRVRIFSDLTSANSIAAQHTWALQLKAADPTIKILYGCTRGNISSSNQAAYTTDVLAEAQWAMDNGMDEFQISNESELHRNPDITDPELRVYLRSLATTVKTVFTRPISYAVPQNFEDGWISEGMGDLDKLSFNIYGNGTFAAFATLAQKVFAAFGTDCFVSEWNIHPSWLSSTVDGLTPASDRWDEVYGWELDRRLKELRRIGFQEAYFFCLWSFSHSFGIDHFCLWLKDEGWRLAAHHLFGSPGRSIYIIKE